MGAAAYDLDDISNTHAHLSNHCLAVDHPDYGKYEPTNELWYSQFDAWLQKTRGKRFEEAILPQIRHITVHTLLAAKEELENADPQRDGCVSFQLCEIQILGSCLGCSGCAKPPSSFLRNRRQDIESAGGLCLAGGLDYMVDADLTVQLLEANVSPACADALLPQFAEDFVQTILDPLFPPAPTVKAEAKHVESGAFKRGFETLWRPADGAGTQA